MALPSQTMEQQPIAISLHIDTLQSFLDAAQAMNGQLTDNILSKAVATFLLSLLEKPGADDEPPCPIPFIKDMHTNAVVRGNWVHWLRDLVPSWKEFQLGQETTSTSTQHPKSHLSMLSHLAAKSSRSAKVSTLISNLIMVSLAIALYKQGNLRLQPSHIKELFKQENDFKQSTSLSPTKVCFGLSPLFLCAPKTWYKQGVSNADLQLALSFSTARPQAVRAVEIKILE
ncbi:hypothetical protein C8J56DRAFT_1174078, partial [Mycena floridula]